MSDRDTPHYLHHYSNYFCKCRIRTLMFSRSSTVLRTCCKRSQAPNSARPTRPILSLPSRSLMWLPTPSQLHTARTPPAIATHGHIPRPSPQQTSHMPRSVTALRRLSQSSAFEPTFACKLLSTACSASTQELALLASEGDRGVAGKCSVHTCTICVCPSSMLKQPASMYLRQNFVSN